MFFILLEKFDCGAQTKSEVGNDNVNKCKKYIHVKFIKEARNVFRILDICNFLFGSF